MTVKDLRTLVDNLDEYIHVPGGIERLKKTILHLAVSGKLVPQDPSEGTGQELYDQIQAEKQKLIAQGKLKKQKPLPPIAADEIPFEIPGSWKWVRLGEVLDLKYGKGIDRKYRNESFAYPFYGANGVLDRVDKYLVQQDGIIVGRKGSAGAVNMVNGPFWPSDVTYYVEDKQFNAFDRKYLFYLLRSLDLNSLANGIKPGLNRNDVYDLLIILLPFKTQMRVAKKVDTLFHAIDKLSTKYTAEQAERQKLAASSLAQLSRGNSELALKHLTEIIRTKADVAELRKTILHLAVSGKLVPQDPSEGTGQELYDQIQVEKARLIAEGKLKKQKPLPPITEDEIPFEIPQSWKWVRLGDISKKIGSGSTPRGGKSVYKSSGPMFLRSQNVWDDGLALDRVARISEDTYQKMSNTIVQPHDVLLNITGASIGRSAIVPHDIAEANVSQHVSIIRPVLYDLSDMLHLAIISSYFQKAIIRTQVGVSREGLSKQSLEKLLIPLPSLAEQTRIASKTIEFLRQVTNLEQCLEK